MATAGPAEVQASILDSEVMQTAVGRVPTQISRYFAWSPPLNRAVGLVLLLLASPLILLCLLGVWATSAGSPVFRQSRVGRGGRVFTIYKIRTMYLDAERHSGPVWTTTTSDPRITPLGRFLRATHLDELPQLINVVAGEMALVGPRPERPEFAQVLAEEIPGYLDRLHVLPGVTGLAQLNLPPDTDVESVRRKLLLDLQYIGQASLGYDFRLLLATAAPLLGIRASAANRLLRVCAGGKLAQAETLVQRPVKLSDEHDEIIRAMTVRT